MGKSPAGASRNSEPRWVAALALACCGLAAGAAVAGAQVTAPDRQPPPGGRGAQPPATPY